MVLNIDKLRRSIRQNLETEALLILLDRAVDLIEPDRLPQLLEGILPIESVQAKGATTQSLLQAVEAFRDDSSSGRYYESFRVNSRNFMDKSRGTINWIAEFHRLMNRCIEQCKLSEYAQAQKAFELLFDLLNEIDKGDDTIVFFADEAGAWQVGVNWTEVLPCYFTALAQVAKPTTYAQKVSQTITAHVEYDRDLHLKTALAMANPTQRKALQASM